MRNLHRFLNEDEIDCLQELMNISYGSATAAIAQIIEKYATLNIPNIKLFTHEQFETYFTEKFNKHHTYYMTNQQFEGTLNGETIFVANEQSAMNLAYEFDMEESEMNEEELKDIILEISNIITSTTLSQLASLVDAHISFLAPSVNVLHTLKNCQIYSKSEYSYIIVIATEIAFENQNIFAELIIMSKDESVAYIKEALKKILEEY